MTQTHLAIDVNPEVFKVKDPRVAKLRKGLMSVEDFAGMIAPGDVFTIVNNVIYALSEAEYYATRAVMPVNVMSDKAFHKVLELEDKSFMHKLDINFLEQVKKDLPGCPACKYKKYKDEVYKLAKKYNIDLAGIPGEKPELKPDDMPYPSTSGEVVPLVSVMVQNMFKTDLVLRTGCIDCVEKHISQAWILGNEALCGYPEHLPLVIGHLGEAIDELPIELKLMKDTLMFCLARTKAFGKPFVPIYALLPLINMARGELSQRMEDQQDNIAPNRTEDMSIDFTVEMMEELQKLSGELPVRLDKLLKEADASTNDRIKWEGAMACAGESIAGVCPLLANMLRNRRLLFIGDPSIAAGEWDLSCITEFIDKCSAETK